MQSSLANASYGEALLPEYKMHAQDARPISFIHIPEDALKAYERCLPQFHPWNVCRC